MENEEEVGNNISLQSESEEDANQFQDALEGSQSEEEETQKQEDQEDFLNEENGKKRKKSLEENDT